MAWTQVAADNFNRAAEAPLSDGGMWSALSAAPFPGPMEIIANQIATNGNTTQWCAAIRSGNAFRVNQKCQSQTANSGGWYGYYWWMLRYAGSTGYFVMIHSLAANNAFYQRSVSGVTTQIGSTMNFICNNSAVECQVVGNVLAGFVNGSAMPTATDSTIPSGGFPGIGCQHSSQIDILGHDNWIGYDDAPAGSGSRIIIF